MNINPDSRGAKRALYLTTACAASILPLAANTIIQETFAYPIGAIAPQSAISSGQENGLPFENPGGIPVGTGTGLRNRIVNTIVVPGLSYTGIASSSNALRHTGSSWADGLFTYQYMTTDPFASLRVGPADGSGMGADGTTLYFSYLFRVQDVTKQTRFVIENTSQGNLFFGLNTVNSGGAFTLGLDPYQLGPPANFAGTVTGPGATISNGATNLVILRSVAGATPTDPDVLSVWVNPTLAGFNGSQTPSHVLTVTAGAMNFIAYKINSDTSNNLTIDELRLGTTLASVIPAPLPPDVTPPVWAAGFPKSDSILSTGFRLRTQVNETATSYYVVLPDGATAPSAAQIKLGQDSTGTAAAKFGTLDLFANVTNNVALTGLIPSTPYDVYLVAEDLVLNQTTPLLFEVTTASSAGSLIISESFSYVVGTVNPDPDGGLNNNNGLPATNIGGVPAGTSTGLRGTWGTDQTVVTGLTYPGLLTSGGAALATTSTWSTNPVYSYQSMTTDPFSNFLRADGSFGKDGQSLYYSVLAQTSSADAGSWQIVIGTGASNKNVYLQNTGDSWSINTEGFPASSGALFAVDTPTLLLLRIDFVDGLGDVFSLWVDPILGTDDLGAPDATTISSYDFDGLTKFQTRPSSANTMIYDEIRVGTTISSVLPSDAVIPTGGYEAWATTNGVTGGVSGDSDNDGVLNSVEYALNTNLTGSDGSVGTFTAGTLSFTKRPAAIANGDVTYVIETSPSLANGSWTPQVTQNPGNADTSITYALPTGQGKIFGRLKVLVNP